MNFLGQLKRLVRKPSCPLSQVVMTLSERRAGKAVVVDACAKREHSTGPLPLYYMVEDNIKNFKLSSLLLSWIKPTAMCTLKEW